MAGSAEALSRGRPKEAVIACRKKEPRGSFFCVAGAGFTTTELVTVIVIAGVLAAVAIPRFSRGAFDESRLHEETLAALRYAQRTALAWQRTVCVTFPSGTQLALAYDPVYGGSTCSANLPAPGGTGGAATYTVTAAGAAAYSGQANFTFDRQGRPSAAQAISIGSRQIRVEAETGYVHEP